MLYGCDVSIWQDYTPTDKGFDFIIAKASESNFIDKRFKQHLDDCKKAGIDLVGAYHYARTTNTPKTDADTFIKAIKSRKELGQSMILALDLEGKDLTGYKPIDGCATAYDWARKWLDIVYEATGIKPVLYISASYAKYCKVIIDGDYGLWVAHWGVHSPAKGVWPFWAFWQTGVVNNLDRDCFNGTRTQYLKYCKSNKEVSNE